MLFYLLWKIFTWQLTKIQVITKSSFESLNEKRRKPLLQNSYVCNFHTRNTMHNSDSSLHKSYFHFLYFDFSKICVFFNRSVSSKQVNRMHSDTSWYIFTKITNFTFFYYGFSKILIFQPRNGNNQFSLVLIYLIMQIDQIFLLLGKRFNFVEYLIVKFSHRTICICLNKIYVPILKLTTLSEKSDRW